MRWPETTSLVAVDWSAAMIRHVWPANGLPRFAAPIRGDWRQLPLASASRDAVIGDGCYTVVGSFDEVALMNAEVRRVLQPGGLYCLRCFTRPQRRMDVAALFDELFSGRFRDLLLFRWLLAAAVQGDSRDGVPLDAVWQAWAEHVPDPSTLRELYGWPEDATGRIERWKGLRMRFLFPSIAELTELAAPHFALIECDVPGHEWGELFPRVLMRAKS
jgi:SAM-dependent methyltransferase